MADLDLLIRDIQSSIEREPPPEFLAKIRDPKGLVKSLKDLRALVGNVEVKNAIAQQTSHLIREGGNRDNMLHTILYGPPGVGKTLIGTKLARIWHALGYIAVPKKEPTLLQDIVPQQNPEEWESLIQLLVVISICLCIAGSLVDFLSKFGIRRTWSLMALLVMVIAFLLFGYLNQPPEPVFFTPSKVHDVENSGEEKEDNENSGEEKEDNENSADVKDEDLIVVVSREDF